MSLYDFFQDNNLKVCHSKNLTESGGPTNAMQNPSTCTNASPPPKMAFTCCCLSPYTTLSATVLVTRDCPTSPALDGNAMPFSVLL